MSYFYILHSFLTQILHRDAVSVGFFDSPQIVCTHYTYSGCFLKNIISRSFLTGWNSKVRVFARPYSSDCDREAQQLPMKQPAPSNGASLIMSFGSSIKELYTSETQHELDALLWSYTELFYLIFHFWRLSVQCTFRSIFSLVLRHKGKPCPDFPSTVHVHTRPYRISSKS